MSEQFFSVAHSFPINVMPLASEYPLPSLEQLEQEMPEPFRIAGAIAHVDMNAARHLRNLDEELGVLVEVINQQSFKINMLLSYLLSQLDDPAYRHTTHSIGASQVSFLSSQPLPLGQRVRLKLFLQEEAAAIYCYGEVSQIERLPTGFHIHAQYVVIREADREALVRATLHIQSRQLKLRAEQRATQPK